MDALLDAEEKEDEALDPTPALDTPALAPAPPPPVLAPLPPELEDKDAFESNLLQSQDKDTAKRLKDYQFERAAGLPIGTTTNDNRQITQDQAAINKAHQDIEGAPTTKSLVIEDPRIAQLTGGDLSGLSKVERAADNITLWGSVTKAGIMMAQHGYAFIETAGELTGIKSLDEFGEKGRLELGKAKKDIKGKETDLFEIDSASDFANWMTSTLAQGAVQFAPQIAGAAAGAKGGAVLGTALAPFTAGVSLPVMTTLGTLIGVVLPSFIMSTGEAQVELKEAGKKAGMGEDVEAPGTVFTAGLFMAGLDSALPFKLWSKMSGKGIKAKVGKEIIRHSLAQIMKRSAKAGVKGMGLEALTETVQDVVKKVLIRNELDLDIIGDPKEFAKDMLRSMAGGAAVGKFMSAGVSVATDVMANSRNTKAALDAMNDATTGEPLREGAPELAAEHIRAVLEEKGVESIFINADVLMDYVQRTDDPEGTLINLGIDETIADSMTNGTDVEIDIATFSEHIMGSAGYNILSMHIKTKPGEKSVSEAADFLWKNNPNLQTDLTAELDKLDLTDHERSLMQRIIDDMTPEKAAQTLAKMNGQTEAVMATLLNSIEERKVTSEAEQKSGRVEFLELEVQSLDKEIVALEDNIEAEGNSESPSIQTLNKLERELQRVRDVRNAKIQEQQDINIPQDQAAALRPEFQETLDQEESSSETTDQPAIPLTPAQKKLRPKKIVTKASVLQDLGIKVTKEAIRAARQGFREGVKAAKTLKAKQKAIVKIIDKLPISESQRRILRDKIMALDVNAKTGESTAKFDRVLDEVMARATVQIELRRKKQISKAIDKELKRARPKRSSSGQPIGRYTAAIHDALRDVEKAIKNLTPADAQLMIDEINSQPADIPSAHSALMNQILNLIANPDTVSSTDMENLLISIKDVKDGGAGVNKANKLARIAEESKLAHDMAEALNPSLGEQVQLDEEGNILLDEEGNPKLAQKVAGKGGKGASFMLGAEQVLFLGWSGSWWNKLGRIMRTSNKALAERVQDAMGLFSESRVHTQNKQDTVNFLEKLMVNRLAISKTALMKMIRQQEVEVVELGPFTHSDGVSRTITMKRGELIQRVAELRNSDIETRSKAKEGNAYNDAIIAALRNELTGQERAQVDALIDFYEQYLPRINAAYSKAYGVNLDKVPGGVYIPTRRTTSEGDGHQDFMQSIINRRGNVTGGSLKGRTGSIAPLVDRTAFGVATAHIAEMEYFIAYHDKVRMINAAFTPKLLKEIQRLYGKHVADSIKLDLQYFTNRGVQNAQVGEQLMLQLMRNFSIAQLAIKPQIAFKQLMSFPAFAQEVSSIDFVAGLRHFVQHPLKTRKWLKENSTFFEQRGIFIDKDFEAVTASNGPKFLGWLGRKPGIVQMLTFNIRVGDQAAIAMGGYAHYLAKKKALKKEGKSEAEAHKLAIKSFERIASRTQQSPDPDQVSAAQRSNSWARLMTQFMSSANALTRAEYAAFVEVSRGRMTGKEFAKQLVIFHVIIPNMIMFAANAFHLDWEDQGRATLFGALNGILIFADVIDAFYGSLTGSEDIFPPTTRHPFRVFTDLLAFAKHMDDISMQDILDGAKGINKSLQSIGGITGLPVSTVFNMTRGITEVTDGEVGKGIMLMLGYSPYTIDRVSDGSGGFSKGAGNL